MTYVHNIMEQQHNEQRAVTIDVGLLLLSA